MQTQDDREAKAGRDPDPPELRAIFLDVVDPVQRLRDRVHGPGHVPDDERDRERDQRRLVGRENPIHGEVDPVEDRLGQVTLERRGDRVRPDVLEPEGSEESEAEQGERHERDERAKGDRRGVRQQAVLGEALGDVVHGRPQAARADGVCSRRHGGSPTPAWAREHAVQAERLDLDEDGVAPAAARADRGEAEPAAVSAQLVHHRREDAGAGGADRMAEGDRASVHVDALRVGAEQLGRVDDDGGEGLVELDALDVVDRLPRLVERLVPAFAGVRAR